MIVTAIAAGAALSLCALVRRGLEAGKGPASLLGGRVLVRRLYNRGSGFGLVPLDARQVAPLSLAALWALLRAYGGSRLGAGLILGGGLSNLYERVRRGRVLDYLRFPRAPGVLKKYTYNLADLFILLGAVLLLLRGRKK